MANQKDNQKKASSSDDKENQEKKPNNITKKTSETIPPELLKEFNGDEQKAQAFLLAIEKRFSGPLPPPEILKQYDQIVPGSAKIIIEDFKAQGAHRRALETKIIPVAYDQSSRGQIFALIIGILGLGSAVFTAYLGETIVACLLGGGTLVSLVLAFLKGKNDSRDQKQ